MDLEQYFELSIKIEKHFEEEIKSFSKTINEMCAIPEEVTKRMIVSFISGGVVHQKLLLQKKDEEDGNREPQDH